MTIWHVYGGETESPLNDLIDTFNETVGRAQNIEELLSGFRDGCRRSRLWSAPCCSIISTAAR